MLRTLQHEQGLCRACYVPSPANRIRQPSWPVQRALQPLFVGSLALLDGLTAYRDFERLRSRGVAHNTALRHSLGIGAPLAAE